MTLDEYAQKVAEEWAEHARQADTLAVGGDIYEWTYHAFMANAISMAVVRSSNETLKRVFNERVF